MDFGIVQAKEWMKKANDEIQEHKERLTELDQAIGDGDHGLNMSRGFQEVANKMEGSEYEDVGAVFKDVAMTLISKVGGASGPLYGSAFLKGSLYAKGKDSLSTEELGGFLQAATEGIKARGKAVPGDKTMVDVWEYAPHALIDGGKEVDWRQWASSLEKKAEETVGLEAKKGRAAYLGARSVGHEDPGAYSSFLLFKALSEVCMSQ